ncbi:MAG: transposase [Pseudomonadota bacterium]
MRHEVIVGVERRRRWSDDQKLSILAEVGVDGATVAEIARRHELTRQHIYQWRRELRGKGLWPNSGETVFLALDPPAATQPPRVPHDSDGVAVEIVLTNGRIVRCRGGMSDADLSHLIRLVEAA